MKSITLSAGLLAVLYTLPSTSANAVGLSLDAGTPGLGVHLSLPITETTNLRLGINDSAKHAFTKQTERVNYDFNLKLRTADALIDWFPARNEFRLTGGLVYNNNRIDGIGLPKLNGSFHVLGETYNFNRLGRIDGMISFRTVSPYFGIGWGNTAAGERGWRFTTDIGVLFQGSPDVNLGTSGCTLPGMACPLLGMALVPVIRTETSRLNDELKNYRFFPVVRIGLAYKF